MPLRHKSTRHAPEKRRIAETVADPVAPGEVVGLSGSTTTTEVARALALRLASGHTEPPGTAVPTGPAPTVVTDSSKTGRRAFARICGPDRIDTLVTDTGVAPETVAQFTGAGVEVLAVRLLVDARPIARHRPIGPTPSPLV